MLDIGWSELVLVGIVALIVVGPKDLPRMFHALGRMTAKARGMAREFQRAMDDAAKSTGLDEVRKDLNDIRNVTSPRALGIDALENAASKFEKWDPTKQIKAAAATANPTLAAAPTVTTAAAAAPVPAEAAAEPVAEAAPVGAATAALAEQKAAEQAAARQKTLELQAKRTEAAAKKFAEKAAEKAKAQAEAEAEAAAQAAIPAPVTEPAVAPGEAAAPTQTVAEAKPARKPPVRRKKSDA